MPEQEKSHCGTILLQLGTNDLTCLAFFRSYLVDLDLVMLKVRGGKWCQAGKARSWGG